MAERRLLTWKRIAVLLAIAAVPTVAHASAGHGPAAHVWLSLAAVLLIAKIGAELALRINQPPVLGELCAGIVLGNLTLIGVDTFSSVATDPTFEFLAEFGVVLLLFEVGLESTLTEMKRVAPQSGMAAILGVVAPMALGFGVSSTFVPTAPTSLHLFVGATLAATSVGITARVLKDLDAMDRLETRIILGAAVIDDVLGLVVLAVVSAIAQQGEIPGLFASGEGEQGLVMIVSLAAGFLVGSLLLGAYVMPKFFWVSSKLRAPGVLGAISIALCLLLAGLSALAGLAAIVGAFAAGLILDEVHVQPFGKRSKHDLSEIVSPIVAIVAPIFFVRTGMQVQLGDVPGHALMLAAALSVAAIIGKLVCGLGVRGGSVDRMTVGIGMVPRGEVGLIFANVGMGIQVAGKPLIDAGVYAAVVLMVMVTTVATPPWLASRLRRISSSPDGSASRTTQLRDTP